MGGAVRRARPAGRRRAAPAAVLRRHRRGGPRVCPDELHGWATEHVRRFRPLPPPDRDAIRRALPDREALWAMLGQRREGERGRHQWSVTPEQWQDFVVECEIVAREDAGVDAARPGDGPFLACEAVDETARDPGRGRALRRLRRPQVPPLDAPGAPAGAQRRPAASDPGDRAAHRWSRGVAGVPARPGRPGFDQGMTGWVGLVRCVRLVPWMTSPGALSRSR